MKLYAHICSGGQERSQPLSEHSRHAACLCSRAEAADAFPNLAFLIGLLHDMGKATDDFQSYLQWASEHPGEKKSHQNHAATAAIFSWERWHNNDSLTAQIIALCILGHHTGLSDCITPDGTSDFLNAMKQDRNLLNYDEAIRNFFNEVASSDELDDLFRQAKEEISAWLKRAPKSFDAGITVRLLLGILADSDRWDSACFEFGEDPFETHEVPDWNSALERFDNYRNGLFTGTSELDRIRASISDFCAERGEDEQNIFRLSVPTGGGKTFASLRFALIHARKHSLKRIFYIIPYNTILDQNAEDIQNALSDTVSVLVHHSNMVINEKDKDGKWKDIKQIEEETEEYRRLTERWDSDVILTSMVQFLNALFLGNNSSARRMRQLTESVLIFDEIQVLPKHCIGLFERAVEFLRKFCRCTVVLCTATQPKFSFPSAEMISDVDGLYRNLKRVQYLPEPETPMNNAEATVKCCSFLEEDRSVLFIVNTKKTAWDLYQKSCIHLKENGWNLVDLPPLASEEQMRQKTGECGSRDILCVHLSTLMCPAHRMNRIHAVKIWTKAGKPVLCISTALIEAGINVSFPVVIRSAAGLPSIIQAGGRCNRNCEIARGEVYIWRLTEEKDSLKRLPDIRIGAEILASMLDSRNEGYASPDALSLPDAIREYFEREKNYTDQKCRFPYIPKGNGTPSDLTEMLGANKEYRKEANSRIDKLPAQLLLRQSFRTVGQEFKVIDENTTAVLVPFGEGKEIITALCGKPDMKELRLLLKRAQAYSVNLYANTIQRLDKEGALIYSKDTGFLILRDGYYGMEGGVSVTPAELEEYIL